MESPHEEIQAVLLERIIKNADKCWEAIRELNAMLQEINVANAEIDVTSRLFMNYRRNVQYNLEARDMQPKPIMLPEEEQA